VINAFTLVELLKQVKVIEEEEEEEGVDEEMGVKEVNQKIK
jgi:hypothetical protein